MFNSIHLYEHLISQKENEMQKCLLSQILKLNYEQGSSLQTTDCLQLPMIFLHVHQARYDQFSMKRQPQFCRFYQ